MKKSTWYRAIAAVMLAGILASAIFGVYTEKKRSEEAYALTEQLLESSGNYEPQDLEILKRYGVGKNQFVSIPFIVGISFITAAVCAAAALVSAYYIRSRNRKFTEIEEYCEAILEGNYALDLRDNEEGQFSIIKNKVYDITVMLREQNHRLEENKKEMESLLADISHQLKTPITSLNMVNEMLYLDLQEEKKLELLDTMQKDLYRMEWFVKMILNLAKVDSGTLELKKEEVCAAAFSEEIISHFQIFCEVNNCEIRTENAGEIRFFCDKKWTKEAVNNLVKNAVEHGAKHICLSWEDNALYTKLCVADDGDGIAKEELPHIFERFYKTKNSRADSVGLGLSFVKSMLEKQNGEVRVTSKIGEGTTFIIKIYRNIL